MADAQRIHGFWPYNAASQNATPPISPFSPSTNQGFKFSRPPSPDSSSSRSCSPSPPPSPPPPPSLSQTLPPLSPRSSIYLTKQGIMPPSTVTVLSTSGSSSSGSQSGSGRSNLPFSRTRSVTDFEIERSERPPKTPTYTTLPLRGVLRKTGADSTEQIFKSNVSALMAAKARPFSICGHLPFDSRDLTLFFRSQSGITHALDFPVDFDEENPPALDVLIAACKPHATCEMDGFSDRESLFYPPKLPLTTTLDIANHPILDAIRTALFPKLASGQYLVSVQDMLEIVPSGGHMCPQRRIAQEEGKVATLVVTLPVRYKGGALVVTDFEGNEEKYYGRGGKPGDLEWTAFLGECDHEVESVQKGCRVTISYNILLKTYGPSPSPTQSLMLPSDRFLDTIAPILNMSRGKTIAMFLKEQYGFSPADVLAETLVPYLKGGDALLYHSLRLYKLVPELRWAAGGYIWPVDATIECGSSIRPKTQTSPRSQPLKSPKRVPSRIYASRPPPGPGGGFSLPHPTLTDSDEDDAGSQLQALRTRVEESGAIPLAEARITVLADDMLSEAGAITKERVPYVSSGVLDKLVVNVLLVVYVP